MSWRRRVTAWHGKGKIEYIPFPEHLKGAYQSYTQGRHQRFAAGRFQQAVSGCKAGRKSLSGLVESVVD